LEFLNYKTSTTIKLNNLPPAYFNWQSTAA